NIFTFDFRGFGLSEGTSSQHGMYTDAEAALAQVIAKGFVADSIVLYGFSLGNVASIHLAANKIRPRALIVESGFASSTSLVQGAMLLDIPSRWLTDGTFDNATTIQRVTSPILVLHGEEDDFVRFRDNGQVIFDNAKDPKRLIAVPGATHTDVPQTFGVARYLDTLRAWIK
ncbi:MAG: alpha/beta hydrolase, partial [bacterium]|nr:alpha/beta hydrolase [Candidatus Kapabacteria bacterium]